MKIAVTPRSPRGSLTIARCYAALIALTPRSPASEMDGSLAWQSSHLAQIVEEQ